MDMGTYARCQDRPAVRFEGSYGHPVERLRIAISDPGELPQWFPSKVALQPQAGGGIEFSGDPNMPSGSGTISEYQAPTRLAFSWGGSELHFELEPAGKGSCSFTLIDVLQAENQAARNAAGWSVCLAELDKLMAGAQASGPHADTQSWREYYDACIAAGMPSGAPIPSAG